MRCKACTWPPAERSALTRPATLTSMPMSWLLPESCGNVLIAGVKLSWLRPLHVKRRCVPSQIGTPASVEIPQAFTGQVSDLLWGRHNVENPLMPQLRISTLPCRGIMALPPVSMTFLIRPAAKNKNAAAG